MYKKELKALKHAGRYRERRVFESNLEDLASNDYLGLAANKKQFNKAVKLVNKYDVIAPRASMLVNGYHPIHSLFESKIAKQNHFDEAIVVGSGFLANMALIDSLVRKGDMLFMDEQYHASGVMAAELLGDRVVFFGHNDAADLMNKLDENPAKRQIVAVEGIYSMSGDLCTKEIFSVCDKKKAILIVDEAHSAGVIGKNLLGIFEYYNITINDRHIKMGTLGKAYGSYGAYILCSKVISNFLLNRARPIIYTTAPSVFDIALAYVNLLYIKRNKKKIRRKISKRQKIVSDIFGIKLPSLILPLVVQNNQDAMLLQDRLKNKGYLVGAIRQPTVSTPIMRVILNTSCKLSKINYLLRVLKKNQKGELDAI